MRYGFVIAGRLVADPEPCYVLAEIGNNHQGDVTLAHQLIDMAAGCGAHGVKFQRRHNRTLYSPALLAQVYDNPGSFGPTYGAHREALELKLEHYPKLRQHAHDKGLGFVVTAFDEISAEELRAVGVDALKIASGGATDQALVVMAASLDVPLLVSTGGCWESDVDRLARWAPGALLLHCTASYPAEFEELNLRVIPAMRQRYPTHPIGWSGHDNGIAMAVLAYALGARLVEKHITLNRAMPGSDHAFSLEHSGLTKLCRDLQRAHVALGDGVKRYYPSERKPIAKMRRRWTPDGPRITGELDA
jgi:N-acetylneuraminate synthase/sialic acid synthase